MGDLRNQISRRWLPPRIPEYRPAASAAGKATDEVNVQPTRSRACFQKMAKTWNTRQKKLRRQDIAVSVKKDRNHEGQRICRRNDGSTGDHWQRDRRAH